MNLKINPLCHICSSPSTLVCTHPSCSSPAFICFDHRSNHLHNNSPSFLPFSDFQTKINSLDQITLANFIKQIQKRSALLSSQLRSFTNILKSKLQDIKYPLKEFVREVVERVRMGEGGRLNGEMLHKFINQEDWIDRTHVQYQMIIKVMNQINEIMSRLQSIKLQEIFDQSRALQCQQQGRRLLEDRDLDNALIKYQQSQSHNTLNPQIIKKIDDIQVKVRKRQKQKQNKQNILRIKIIIINFLLYGLPILNVLLIVYLSPSMSSIRNSIYCFDKYNIFTIQDPFEAVEYYKKKAIENPECNFQFELGVNFLKLHYFDAAVEVFTKAIRKNPNTSHYYENRMVSYSYLGEYKKSIKDCEKAIELQEQQQSQAWIQKRERSESIERLREILRSYKVIVAKNKANKQNKKTQKLKSSINKQISNIQKQEQIITNQVSNYSADYVKYKTKIEELQNKIREQSKKMIQLEFEIQLIQFETIEQQNKICSQRIQNAQKEYSEIVRRLQIEIKQNNQEKRR